MLEYTNEEEEGKKKINGLDRSVRWSEELSFRANHRYIMSGNSLEMCAWCHGNYGRLCQWSFYVKQSYYTVTCES